MPEPSIAPGSPDVPARGGARGHLVALAALLLLGLAAYANAYGGPFVFDDGVQVRDQPLAQELSAWAPGGAGWRQQPGRAVAFISFALNRRLLGPGPRGYHAVNVAIHLANALLVYALVVLALRAPRVRSSWLAPHAGALGFAAAALFVTHPIQTQAVTYVVQRMTSLATLFYVASVALFLAWRLAPAARRAWRAAAYAGALACALLAMSTKEIAFTLPLVVVLLELALFDAADRRWLALAPIVATALVVPLALATRAPLMGALSGSMTGNLLEQPPPRLTYLATQVPVVVSYLGLVLLPVGQNVDHDVPLQRSFLGREVLTGLALLAALAALAAILWRRTTPGARRPLDPAARLVAVGLAWWFLALSVESAVPIVDVMNEHRIYLPSVGLFTALAVAGAFLARRLFGAERAPARLVAAVAVLALLLAFATLLRNVAWRSEVRLWADAAAKSPGKLRPSINLGTALISAGRPDRAVPVLRRATELAPASYYAHAQLASALLGSGRPAEAEPELRETLRLAPQDPEALFNLATVLWETGRREEAVGWYARYLDAPGQTPAAARRLAAARAAPAPAPRP